MLVVGSVLATGLNISGSASAEPPSDQRSAAEIAALVDQVAGSPVGSAPEVVAGAIEGAQEDRDAVAVTGPDGSELSIGVPGTDAGDQVRRSHENLVYPNVEPDTSVVARSVPGGTQALVVIDGPDAPSTFAFPLEVDGRPVRLEAADGGSVTVFGAGSTVALAQVAPAWAVDAVGRPVPTHFEVEDEALRQVVDHAGAAYPVIADPQFTWGWVTGTVYFTRSETRRATTVSGILSIAATLCAGSLVTGPAATAFCTGVFAHSGIVAFYANDVYGSGKCLKLKLPTFEPGSVRRGDRNCR
jgi:hypothetical protein